MALPDAPARLDPETAYREMLTIRRFEERCLELRRRDEIAGSIHLCAGQEAIPVGALSALADGDRVVATYRGHGWAIACGVPLDALMAEICQRETGINGGRAGSPFLTAPGHGFLGENSIVGAGVPIAAGAALAAQARGEQRVVLVSIGDGATSQGATHEGMLFAASRKLPLIILCEHNGWSEMTSFSTVVAGGDLSRRPAAYGLPGALVDGNDPMAVAGAVAEAAERARRGDGPTFIEARCHRLWGHYNSDTEHYRPSEDRERAIAGDPVTALRISLESRELGPLEAAVDGAIEAAAAATLAAPAPDPATAREHVHGAPVPTAGGGGARDERELTFGKAVNEALRRELSARPEVLVYGEDVGAAGGIFGITRTLRDEFGDARVFDTPIAESAILGSAVGAAMEGMRPVVEIMWGDFLLVALDQLVNQAANVRYISRGERSAPLVVRTQQGVTPGSCAQHSQSLEALLAHIPGLRVGVPATAQDAYAMLRSAIADDDPCILFEARSLYARKGTVALGAPAEPLGGARLRQPGRDLAIITWGAVVHEVLAAADRLAANGVDAAVLDLRWLSPLDEDAIAAVVGAASRVLIVHEANVTGGFGAEIAARIADRHFFDLDAPIHRLGAPDVRFPSAPSLQEALLPSADKIVAAATTLLAA